MATEMKRYLVYLYIVVIVAIFPLLYVNYYNKGSFHHETSAIAPKVYEPIEEIDYLKFPIQFLKNYKNPCWYELEKADKSPSKGEERTQQLRCLPYFFLIGQPKCGTTDLYERIVSHPAVASANVKGIHWWTRTRFAQDDKPKDNISHVSFSRYVSMFSKAASKIEKSKSDGTNLSAMDYHLHDDYHHVITGDGSPSTMWDGYETLYDTNKLLADPILGKYLKNIYLNQHKKVNHNLREDDEVDEQPFYEDISLAFKNKFMRLNFKPVEINKKEQLKTYKFGVPDLVHFVIPRARIIAILREPASRLFSSYLFFKNKHKTSPEDFDKDVTQSITKWQDCVKVDGNSEITCAYNKTLHKTMRVRLYNGMYSVYLKQWMKVFSRSQLLILRTEDLHNDIKDVMDQVFRFLKLDDISTNQMNQITNLPIKNKNKNKKSGREMLKRTEVRLKKFYKHYNVELSSLLNNNKFLWDNYR